MHCEEAPKGLAGERRRHMTRDNVRNYTRRYGDHFYDNSISEGEGMLREFEKPTIRKACIF